MFEVAALALAAAAVALSYGADGPRGAPRWASLRAQGRAPAARALALVLVGAAVALWNRAEPGPAAFLAVPLALLAAGSVLTLSAPVALRGLRRAREGAARARRGPASERPTLETEAPAAPTDVDAPPKARGRALLVLSVTLGTLPVALLASAAVARFLPVSADARYAAGFGLAIPLWQLGMCVALLARRGASVLGVCFTLSAALAALVFGIQP